MSAMVGSLRQVPLFRDLSIRDDERLAASMTARSSLPGKRSSQSAESASS
jgi:hypothetical protein